MVVPCFLESTFFISPLSILMDLPLLAVTLGGSGGYLVLECDFRVCVFLRVFVVFGPKLYVL
ncbi:unnamed protein product [Prunus brigantina]